MLSVVFKENKIESFNFLKDYATEGDVSGTRNPSMLAQTAILSNRNYGMILDLVDPIANSQVLFDRNEVRNIHFHYKKVDAESDTINHCEGILDEQPN